MVKNANFIIFWAEKCIGKYWDKDPFGNAIPGTATDRYTVADKKPVRTSKTGLKRKKLADV